MDGEIVRLVADPAGDFVFDLAGDDATLDALPFGSGRALLRCDGDVPFDAVAAAVARLQARGEVGLLVD